MTEQGVMDALIKQLALARKEEKEAKADLDALQAGLEAQANYIGIKGRLVSAREQTKSLDEIIRQGAVNAYLAAEVKNKKPHPKVGIREKVTFVYQNEENVREWCLANFVAALGLNKDVFEKYALTAAKLPDGVITKIVVTATIASNLDDPGE